jgi:hypothetical protein
VRQAIIDSAFGVGGHQIEHQVGFVGHTAGAVERTTIPGDGAGDVGAVATVPISAVVKQDLAPIEGTMILVRRTINQPHDLAGAANPRVVKRREVLDRALHHPAIRVVPQRHHRRFLDELNLRQLRQGIHLIQRTRGIDLGVPAAAPGASHRQTQGLEGGPDRASRDLAVKGDDQTVAPGRCQRVTLRVGVCGKRSTDLRRPLPTRCQPPHPHNLAEPAERGQGPVIETRDKGVVRQVIA